MKHRKTFPAKRALRDERCGVPTVGVPATATGAAPAQPLIIQAISLQNAGKLLEAEALFRQVLAEQPDDAPALYSLAVILMGRPDAVQETLRVTEHGVSVAPAFAPLWLAHAGVLQQVGHKEAALVAYDRALALKPDYTEALVNSGVLLRELHRHRDALLRFNQVLTFQPDHATALANCGVLLTEFKQSDQAIAMFERLMKIKPDYDYLPGLLNYERLHACDWTDFEPLTRHIIDGVRAGKRTSKTLGLMAISDSASDHFLAARIFAAHWFSQPRRPLWRGERYDHARLRIAYVSPDLREHPVGHLMAGIFERHDKKRFETYAFSLGIDDGSRLRKRMVAAFDHFFDVRSMGTEAIAELMREHEIDVAIDLAGYTSDSRLEVFAYRPAPVQATFLGYPGTLGTNFFDYIIADRHVLPKAHQCYYAEKVAYLPDTYLPTDAGIEVSERTPTRAECGLPDAVPVLCSFSHDYKIHPALFAAWLRVLKRLPGSVLWLVSRNDVSHRNLRSSAAAAGVDPSRLVFATRIPRIEDHLARYRLADVFLDTSPYNAHTTAADALMSGLPVITFMGDSFPSRVAGSLLHAIGLPELIADSLAGYEALVVDLVSDPARLQAIKQRLAENKATHALFDTDRFCRNLEALYAEIATVESPEMPTAAKALADATAGAVVETPALRAELQSAEEMLSMANFPQAELHLRRYHRSGGRDRAAATMLDAVSAGYGVPSGFQLVEPAAPAADRYLLIKAWGFGFWSDVHHVLSQLLVAELTGRTPVVHWGRNTLFGDGSGADAFTHFFAPVSTASLSVLQALPADTPVFPAKWTVPTLADENVRKWSGPESRRAAQFCLARSEPLVVSDFYTPVSSLIPWIATGSQFHGLSEDSIYAALYAKYLRPTAAIADKALAFAESHLHGRSWVAVHIRGSDKIKESRYLHETNARYFEFVDRVLALNPQLGVFLMTDSLPLHGEFAKRYGKRLIATSALRSATDAGVHLQGHDGRRVGEEVLVDALLAARCDYFIGNRESNVSLAVSTIKAWPQGTCVLLGQENCRGENPFLHRPPDTPNRLPLPSDPPQTNSLQARPAGAALLIAAQPLRTQPAHDERTIDMNQKSIADLHRTKVGKVSDKWASYLDYYDQLFASLRDKPISMLEIGVQNGGSLETWSSYFARGECFIGCDIDPKCGGLRYDDPRVHIVVGDANATTSHKAIRDIRSSFDIVIDDGSHVSIDVLNAFVNYFPLVKPGGLFVVEDTHTLYNDDFGGGILNEFGAYGFFKKLVDVPSFQFWRDQLSINTYFRTFFPLRATPGFLLEGWVESVEFRNSVITIRKSIKPSHDKLGERIIVGRSAQVQDWQGAFVPS